METDSSQTKIYITPFVDATIKDILAKYGDKKQALLPILSIMQREYGKFTDESLTIVAGYTKLPPKIIKETHDHYYPAKRNNIGKFKIFVCINYTCALKQSREIVDFISSYIGIHPGQATEDGLFSLVTLQCLGGCFTPPTVKINGTIYQEMDKYKTKKVLDEMIAGYKKTQNNPSPCGRPET